MAINQQELLDTIGNMTVLELSEFVDLFKEKFNVTAAVAVAPAAAGAAEAEAEVEEQTEFEVVLESFGAKKIQVIKVVRELTSLGLKEAKALVDGVPNAVKEAVSKDEAEQVRQSSSKWARRSPSNRCSPFQLLERRAAVRGVSYTATPPLPVSHTCLRRPLRRRWQI